MTLIHRAAWAQGLDAPAVPKGGPTAVPESGRHIPDKVFFPGTSLFRLCVLPSLTLLHTGVRPGHFRPAPKRRCLPEASRWHRRAHPARSVKGVISRRHGPFCAGEMWPRDTHCFTGWALWRNPAPGDWTQRGVLKGGPAVSRKVKYTVSKKAFSPDSALPLFHPLRSWDGYRPRWVQSPAYPWTVTIMSRKVRNIKGNPCFFLNHDIIFL